MKDKIQSYLNTNFIGKTLYHFNTIDSTNIKAKELGNNDCHDGTVVVSEEQTAGRGRLGRTWLSPIGSTISTSILVRPNIEPIHASKLTLVAAAAVHSGLLEHNINTKIKWPNDIVINNKKICGMLTEMKVSSNKINHVIVGIGINVNLKLQDIDDIIKETASSICIEYNKTFDKEILLASILYYFELYYLKYIETLSLNHILHILRENSAVIGKEVIIIDSSNKYIATAIDIDDTGELLVKYNDEIKQIISGEVSIRGLNGYI